MLKLWLTKKYRYSSTDGRPWIFKYKFVFILYINFYYCPTCIVLTWKKKKNTHLIWIKFDWIKIYPTVPSLPSNVINLWVIHSSKLLPPQPATNASPLISIPSIAFLLALTREVVSLLKWFALVCVQSISHAVSRQPPQRASPDQSREPARIFPSLQLNFGPLSVNT